MERDTNFLRNFNSIFFTEEYGPQIMWRGIS
jgi:hypothetical protein